MSGETRLTIAGNLVEDPELRITPSGDAVVNFRVASTPRTFSRDANEWRDGDSLFLRCTAWRALAEHVASSVRKGHRVVVTGSLVQRSYEDAEGVRKYLYEVKADDVAVSLAYATAVPERAPAASGRRVADPVAV